MSLYPVISLPAQTNPGGPATVIKLRIAVSYTIIKTGTHSRLKVLQPCLTFPNSAGEQPRALCGFEKMSVEKGATALVTIQVDVSVWGVVWQRWEVPEEAFGVAAGTSSGN